MTQPTAALYIRVSTRHQAEEGFSLADQRDALTALAQERGWSFRLYVDAGVSGERIDNRPALLDLLHATANGELDVVAVVDESRLARDELTAAVIRDKLKTAGITLVTPSGDRDLSDPSGSFVATVLGAAAALEQDLRTAKMTAGLKATAKAGFWPGGPAPFGYRLAADPAGSKHKILSINESEASVIRQAVSLILDHGHSTWTATKVLNATGNPTRSGRPWYFRNLAHQLNKPSLTGRFAYQHPSGPISIQIPAILTESRWQAVQAVIRAVPGDQTVNKFYALTGYLRCACGGSISGVSRKDRDTRYYKCTRTSAPIPTGQRCPHYPRQIPADQLETQVWDAIHDLLTDPDRLRQAAQRHIAASTHSAPQKANQRATVAHRLDELDLEETGVIRAHARDHISNTQLTTTLDQISDERTTLKSHLNQLDLWDQQSRANQANLDQLQQLARDAKTRLKDPTPQEQRRIYELLQLRITIAADRSIDITGSLPNHGTLDPPETSGQLSATVPQHP